MYASINIIGLATGMAVALIDQYHKKHALIAQVMDTQINKGDISTSGQ